MDNLDPGGDQKDWVSSVMEMNIYDLEELLEYAADGSYLQAILIGIYYGRGNPSWTI